MSDGEDRSQLESDTIMSDEDPEEEIQIIDDEGEEELSGTIERKNKKRSSKMVADAKAYSEGLKRRGVVSSIDI